MDGATLAIVGAVLAIGGPAITSAIGSGITGATASGVIAEKKQEFMTGLILEALPQAAVIFGFVVAIMIVGEIKPDISVYEGTKLLCAGIAMAAAGFTPIAQIPVLSAGVGSTARAPETRFNNIIYGAIPDISVVLGFVIAFLLIVG